MTTHLAMQACLACGYRVDCHSQLATAGEGGPSPEAGDVSICIKCGTVMIYDRRLRFRWPTKAEIAECNADERIRFGIEAIGRLHKIRRQ